MEWAVKRMRNNRAGGAVKDAGGGPERVAGGSEEGEKERETKTKDGGDRGGEWEGQTEAEGHWRRVVEIIQTAFRDGELAEEVTWQAVVLIPKGKGDYRGIM